MKVNLELFTARPAKDGSFPLVIRFAINRKQYRYLTGLNLTEAQWAYERRHGHVHTFKAIEQLDKAKELLAFQDPSLFNMNEFRKLMEAPVVAQNPVTKLFDEYLKKRGGEKLAVRTRELDDCTIKKLKEFFVDHPHADNVHTWDTQLLNDFHKFMIDGKLSVATAGIYLRIFSAFFTWLIDDKEMLIKHPFKKYEIPKYDNNWFPYSDKELKTILSLSPKTPAQKEALLWSKMIVHSGGTDMKDFAEMTWRQVHSEAIQVQRIKTKQSSSSSNKLLYLSESIREILDQLKTKRGKADDYVFGIYKKDKSEKQNLEFLKAKMNSINDNMNEMLKESYVHFTIKRLRPTAATIANNSTKDINFVKGMLMHSNIKQTDTYLKRTPSDVNKANQEVFEEALKKISVQETSGKSGQRSTE